MTETPISKNFQLNGDDVVSMEADASIIGTQTFRVSQFTQNLRKRLGASALESWFGEGIECELLIASRGGGWQTGKIRIRVEFIPDVPEVSSDTNSLDPLWTEEQL